jgi:hypothetical protein
VAGYCNCTNKLSAHLLQVWVTITLSVQWKFSPSTDHSHSFSPVITLYTGIRTHAPFTSPQMHLQLRMKSTWHILRSITIWMVCLNVIRYIPFLSRCSATYRRFWWKTVFFLILIYRPNEKQHNLLDNLQHLTYSNCFTCKQKNKDEYRQVLQHHTMQT